MLEMANLYGIIIKETRMPSYFVFVQPARVCTLIIFVTKVECRWIRLNLDPCHSAAIYNKVKHLTILCLLPVGQAVEMELFLVAPHK